MRNLHVATLLCAFAFGFSSIPALAEDTLHLEVEAANVDTTGQRVSLLVKVKDNDSGKDNSGRITTTLPAPGSCSPRFKDGVQFVVGPCFGVQLWENGNPVETVKVRVLDTHGDSNYAVLTWNSTSTLPASERWVKAIVGVANGWYSDNPDTAFPIRNFPLFNPGRPYAFLLGLDDRELNLAYHNVMSSFHGKDADRQVTSLRDEERVWVGHKENDCREAGDPDRCRWLATVDRLDVVTGIGQE